MNFVKLVCIVSIFVNTSVSQSNNYNSIIDKLMIHPTIKDFFGSSEKLSEVIQVLWTESGPMLEYFQNFDALLKSYAYHATISGHPKDRCSVQTQTCLICGNALGNLEPYCGRRTYIWKEYLLNVTKIVFKNPYSCKLEKNCKWILDWLSTDFFPFISGPEQVDTMETIRFPVLLDSKSLKHAVNEYYFNNVVNEIHQACWPLDGEGKFFATLDWSNKTSATPCIKADLPLELTYKQFLYDFVHLFENDPIVSTFLGSDERLNVIIENFHNDTRIPLKRLEKLEVILKLRNCVKGTCSHLLKYDLYHSMQFIIGKYEMELFNYLMWYLLKTVINMCEPGDTVPLCKWINSTTAQWKSATATDDDMLNLDKESVIQTPTNNYKVFQPEKSEDDDIPFYYKYCRTNPGCIETGGRNWKTDEI